MPSPYSIDRSVAPVVQTHSLGNAVPEIKTATYRNKSISLMKSAGKSAKSLFARLYSKVSARLPSLFTGKTKYVVTPGNPALLSTLRFQELRGKYKSNVPAASVPPTFEEYVSARRNLRIPPAAVRFEPQQQDVVGGGVPSEPRRDIAETVAAIEPAEVEQGMAQYIEPQAEQASAPAPAPAPTPLEETAPPALEDLPDEAPTSVVITQGDVITPEEDAPPPQLSVRQRVAQLESQSAAAPSPRSVFMNSQLSERDIPYRENFQMFDTRSRAEPPLRPFDRNRFRSAAYLATAGRQNVRGAGFAGGSLFPQSVASSANAQGVWPLGIPDDQFSAPKVSLKEAVAAWYPAEQRQEIMTAWRDLAPEENPEARTFSEYLVRLGNAELNDGVLGDVADFREFVQAWLTQVSHSPDLLEQTLVVAQDATTTCDDRVLLTFNQMQSPRVLDDVNNTVYDLRLPDLVTAGRRQFRLERLQDQASIVADRRLEEEMTTPLILGKIERAGARGNVVREEIRATLLAGSEELETHLLMQIDNASDLDLDLPIKEMRYRGIAKLSSEQRAAAGERVKEQENAEFKEWFVQSAPWLAMLERQDPAGYAQAIERKHEILEQVFETLEADIDADIAQMQASGESAAPAMTADAIGDLRRGLGKARTDRIAIDAFLPATEEFLTNQGHGGALNPHWA